MALFPTTRWTFRTYIVILCAFYLLLVLVFHSQLQFRRIEILNYENERMIQSGLIWDGTEWRYASKYPVSSPFHQSGQLINRNLSQNNRGDETNSVLQFPLKYDLKRNHSDGGVLTSNCTGSTVDGNKFHDLNDQQLIYVYSAYWDVRYNDFDNKVNGTFLRIMSVVKMHKKPELTCHFDLNGKLEMVTASYYEMCENHNMHYGGFILSCRVPEKVKTPPCSVKLSLLNAPNAPVFLPVWLLEPEPERLDHGICAPPLFGTLNEKSLVEFIETSKLMGVQKITFYRFKVSINVQQILNYYVDQGDAVIVPWNLPALLDGQLWYHGQLIAIQDCLYRNMHKFKFLAFNDIDEFIVSHSASANATWAELTRVLHSPKSCGYQFKSAYFDRNDQSGNKTHNGLITQERNMRTETFSNVRTKCIVKPYKIFEKGIHHISKPILAHLEIVPVSPSVGFVHHYRACVANFGMNCKKFVKDISMRNFEVNLYAAISNTYTQLGSVNANFFE